jgi:hypothetical protein
MGPLGEIEVVQFVSEGRPIKEDLAMVVLRLCWVKSNRTLDSYL